MTRTTRTLLLCLATALFPAAAHAAPGSAKTFPEPKPFAVTWEFEFTHAKPLAISVPGEDGQNHWYWFMAYKVANRTGDDRLFIPDVTVTTDRGDAVTANKNIPANVYVAVKARIGNALQQSPNQATGPLLQGEDYAKESVIVWRDFGHDIDQLNIMIAGLSGEWVAFEPGRPPEEVAAENEKAAPAPADADAKSAEAPATQPSSAPAAKAPAPAAGKPGKNALIFRKTLMITYDLPGTNVPVLETVLIPRGETWIMR